MRTLDVQARLEYARAAVAVLRALRIMDATMTYRDFATAIGMMSENEKWEVWHRDQVTVILNLIAATERQGRSQDAVPLEFRRVVKAADKQPGKGFYKTSKIVTKK
jgi:hypothetical protein